MKKVRPSVKRTAKAQTKKGGLRILFVASEAVPFAKTGGLADVAGSLPLALGEAGHEVLLVIPRYRGISVREAELGKGVRVVFADRPEYFDRPELYGENGGDYPDSHLRFSFLPRRALEIARERKFSPHILHGHDWHTGLLALYRKTLFAGDPLFAGSKSLLTIHNLAYQGIFEDARWKDLDLARGDSAGTLRQTADFDQKINFLKAGLESYDALSTVSPAYADEIQGREEGCGLDGILRSRRPRLFGILNGLDVDHWDPQKDKNLAAPFSASKPRKRSMTRGALRQTCGWAAGEDLPIFAMVTRLAEQKGLDLLVSAWPELSKRKARWVVLGTGEKRYEDFLRARSKESPKTLCAFLKFHAAQASLLYGGSDFFVMPSRFEPCGLGQMIALRYGSVPLVRKTGGLKDTVRDFEGDPEGSGIVFDDYRPEALVSAVDRAIELYGSADKMAALRRIGMSGDYSWQHSAVEYEKLYRRLTENKGFGA